ncbi:MAG: ABC transporter permease subunit, partial [Acholeplasmatales bacterium]|nr:ABC transporter permease subunit [Acholeplasmatales bacterium]
MKDSIIKNNLLHKILIYVLSIFVLYLAIILLSNSYNNEVILPHPNSMIKEFFNLLGDGDTYTYIGNTLKTLIISIIFCFIIGLVLGVLAGIFKYIRYFLKPWITIMRSLPLASLIILIMLLVELDNTPYIVCGLVLIPIIYEGICNAIMDINKEYIDVYKLESNLNFKVIFKVYLPL